MGGRHGHRESVAAGNVDAAVDVLREQSDGGAIEHRSHGQVSACERCDVRGESRRRQRIAALFEEVGVGAQFVG